MKRLSILILLIVLCLPFEARAKGWIYPANAGTTGGTTGTLDNIDACNTDGGGTDLQDKDVAIVSDPTNGQILFYWWDDDNASAEDDPYIVRPDKCDGVAHASNGRWILLSVRSETFRGEADKLNDSDGETITAEQASRGIIVYESGNQQTIVLPAVEDGMVVCVFMTGADSSAELYLDPNGSDHIDYGGTSASAGEYIHNTSNKKDDYICVIAEGANTWKVWGSRGTWIEQTP